MPPRLFEPFHREACDRRPLGGMLAEGMALGLIACVAVLAGWEALSFPELSRHSRFVVLAAAVLTGAVLAALWGAEVPRMGRRDADGEPGEDPRS
jgi:hypothetical protein